MYQTLERALWCPISKVIVDSGRPPIQRHRELRMLGQHWSKPVQTIRCRPSPHTTSPISDGSNVIAETNPSADDTNSVQPSGALDARAINFVQMFRCFPRKAVLPCQISDWHIMQASYAGQWQVPFRIVDHDTVTVCNGKHHPVRRQPVMDFQNLRPVNRNNHRTLHTFCCRLELVQDWAKRSGDGMPMRRRVDIQWPIGRVKPMSIRSATE